MVYPAASVAYLHSSPQPRSVLYAWRSQHRITALFPCERGLLHAAWVRSSEAMMAVTRLLDKIPDPAHNTNVLHARSAQTGFPSLKKLIQSVFPMTTTEILKASNFLASLATGRPKMRLFMFSVRCVIGILYQQLTRG